MRKEKQVWRERTLSGGKTLCGRAEEEKQQEENLRETRQEEVGWGGVDGAGVELGIICLCDCDHW